MNRLRGLRVLVTRPEDQAQETAEEIECQGGTALCYPCLQLAAPLDQAPLDAAVDGLRSFSVVALTSANAARALLERLWARGILPRQALDHAVVATVGERTARVLREQQVRVDVAGAGTGEELGRALLSLLGAGGLNGRTVLFPRAAEARDKLLEVLRAAGAQVTPVEAYRMVPPPLSRLSGAVAALRAGEVDLLPLGSPRTAEVLLTALRRDGPQVLRATLVGAIGPTTQGALERAGVAVDFVPQEADFSSLLSGLAELYAVRKTGMTKS